MPPITRSVINMVKTPWHMKAVQRNMLLSKYCSGSSKHTDLMSSLRLRQHDALLAPLSTQRWLLIIGLMLIAFAQLSATCSTRGIPKPRPTLPTAMTTSRPNITFPIYPCPPTYAAWYCLNEATCFTVEINNEILYNCECANGFMGPRCEFKEIDGSYLPTRQRAMLETASIASGAFLALCVILMLCLSLYMRHENKLKIKVHENGAEAHENEGMDTVDGMTRVPVMRPFGPHHYQVLPLAMAFRR